MQRILVTGHRGLIGTVLTRRLREEGHEVVGYDVADHEVRDVTDAASLYTLVSKCTGVVHLAAVSRVVPAERDPVQCRLVNVQGTKNVLKAVTLAGNRVHWVLYGSSREVYGEADLLPVSESAPHRPMNVYARSKVDAEKLVEASRDEAGIRASIVRFSNVYGSLSDHRDRVIPAFARLASEGGVLSVEGSETTLDFTHVEDVVTGLMRMIEIMSSGDILPTIHLVSGQGTTLNELAMMAVKIARKGTIEINSARLFDVNSFIGDTARAVQLLDWRASTPIREGFGRLITLFLPADT